MLNKYKLITILALILQAIFANAKKVEYYDSLMVEFEKSHSLKIAQEIYRITQDNEKRNFGNKDPKEIIDAGTYCLYASYKVSTGDLTSAYTYAKKSIEISKNDTTFGMIQLSSSSCNTISMCYDYWGMYDKAIEYAEKSMEYDDKNIEMIKDLYRKKQILKKHYDTIMPAAQISKAISYANMVSMFINNNQYDMAVKYIDLAIEIYNKIGDLEYLTKNGLAGVYSTASVVYSKKNQLDKAYEYAYKAYQFDSTLYVSDTSEIGETSLATKKRKLATILEKMGEKERAIQLTTDALKIFEKNGYKNSTMADCLNALGRHEDALKIAREIGDIIQQEKFLRELARQEKDRDKAIGYMEEAITLHDSIMSANNGRTLEGFNAEFESERKEHEIAQQKAELEKQQAKWTLTVMVSVLVLLLALIAVFGWIRDNRNKKKLADALNKLSVANNELELANKKLGETNRVLEHTNKVKDRLIRVISHDLSGTTANINMLAHMMVDHIKNDISTLLVNQSDNLKSFLDNLLIWARMQRTGTVQLNKVRMSLNEVVDKVIEMNKCTAESKSITLKAECKSDCLVNGDRDIIHCVIRNLVSNALKFTQKGGSITIKFDESQVSVIDTGKGLEPELIPVLLSGSKVVHTEGTDGEPGSGLGLSIVRDMIDMSGAKFEIESELGKGSIFRMSFLNK